MRTLKITGVAALVFAAFIFALILFNGAPEGRSALASGRPALADSAAPADSKERFLLGLAKAAQDRTRHEVVYDPSYFVIPYPGGDVPADRGVCTDVVIRAYRTVGVDLQKEVHLDMKNNFKLYPKKWGLEKPDPNIDHRRVPNLMTFFGRKGESLPIAKKAGDYGPGEIVCWDLNGEGLTHIGIVSAVKGKSGAYMVVHNIGAGPRLEDCLFDWKQIGHYRYFGPEG